jgi:hypothetical protein
MALVKASRKKGRKCGRSRVKCERYRKLRRREINKARKVRKHIKHNPNDLLAVAALAALK